MKDKRRGNVLIWIGVGALIVIILLILFWKPNASQAPSGGTGVNQPMPTFAAQGQVAQGFPTSLILDSAALVGPSFSIDYSQANQYTAQYASTMSVATLFAKYKTYLAANGWTITNQKAKTSFDSVYATNATSSVNVVITPATGGSQVVVTFDK